MPQKEPLAKPLNEEQAERLARLGCTTQIIADIYGLTADEVWRRFGDAITRGSAKLKCALLTKQVEIALNGGSVAMLIWLGKQLLGQREHVEMITDPGRDGPTFNAIPWTELPIDLRTRYIEVCAERFKVKLEPGNDNGNATGEDRPARLRDGGPRERKRQDSVDEGAE